MFYRVVLWWGSVFIDYFSHFGYFRGASWWGSICAMMKKSRSRPMVQILERLCRFEFINVVVIPEDVILDQPVELWPLCDVLVSFHSKGEEERACLYLV